jgi:hypothetical protein
MAMPNPIYASPVYASQPSLPQMANTTPYYNVPAPYTPTLMAAQQTPGKM